MKMFRTRFSKQGQSHYSSSNKIEAVEVERKSEACVWIGGRRTAMRSTYDNYFDTWVEARTWLQEEANEHMEWAQDHLARAQKTAAEIASLTEADILVPLA